MGLRPIFNNNNHDDEDLGYCPKHPNEKLRRGFLGNPRCYQCDYETLMQMGKEFDRKVAGQMQAIKLEPGNQQTLARKLDNGLWEKIDQQNNDMELLKCQKYLIMGKLESIYLTANYVFLPTPIKMRIKPSIIGDPIVNTVATNTTVSNSIVSCASVWENGVVLSYTNSSEPCYIYFPTDTGLSAEL